MDWSGGKECKIEFGESEYLYSKYFFILKIRNV